MSTMTMETMTGAPDDEPSILHAMADLAAIVAEIGPDKVSEVHAHRNDCHLYLASHADTWQVGDQLGMSNRYLGTNVCNTDVERCVYAYEVGGLPYLELHGWGLDGDEERYLAENPGAELTRYYVLGPTSSSGE